MNYLKPNSNDSGLKECVIRYPFYFKNNNLHYVATNVTLLLLI